MKLRPEVLVFAQAMERQLRANDEKGGWDQETLSWLFGSLQEEVEELQEVLGLGKCTPCRCGSFPPSKVNPAAVVREAADVANFAMMLADNAAKRKGVT
jgi:NTP pyrophosphatase (non-canonical NTP hydrolase)